MRYLCACFLLILFHGPIFSQQEIVILTKDIDNFWTAYDKLPSCETGADSIQAFQEFYIDQGTEGLQEFIKKRNFTAAEYYKVVREKPRFWQSIRPNTLKLLTMEPEIREIYQKYEETYPGHRKPKICFAIGTLRTGGTTSKEYMLIGSEIVAADRTTDKSELNRWMQSVMTDEMEVPGFVAHEYIHTQQKINVPAIWAALNHRLLFMSLLEGACDFLSEEITGWKINQHLHHYGQDHEEEIRAAFDKEKYKNNFSNWLYQGNNTQKGVPADLGYYVGYKICEAYFAQANNPQKALQQILHIKNYKRFLKKSGYLEKISKSN